MREIEGVSVVRCWLKTKIVKLPLFSGRWFSSITCQTTVWLRQFDFTFVESEFWLFLGFCLMLRTLYHLRREQHMYSAWQVYLMYIIHRVAVEGMSSAEYRRGLVCCLKCVVIFDTECSICNEVNYDLEKMNRGAKNVNFMYETLVPYTIECLFYIKEDGRCTFHVV